MTGRGWMSAMLMLFCIEAQAVVSLGATRLIFDGRFHEATLEVSNPGDTQVLIQTWLGDARAERAVDLPFVVTPPLTTLPPQGRQPLRVLYEGVGMPADRESLLHLYVLEIPRRSEVRQQLSLAIRQRINVFYRPRGLSGDPAEAAQTLAWQWEAGERSTLEVRNPTPFHVSLHQLRIDDTPISEDLLLEPFSQHAFTLPTMPDQRAPHARLNFKALTDYGGSRDYCAHVRGTQPFHAQLRLSGAYSSIGKC